MGWYIGLGLLLNLMMTADQWGGPLWLVGLGQGICTLAIPAGFIAGIYSACYATRTTPTHLQPPHNDQQNKK